MHLTAILLLASNVLSKNTLSLTPPEHLFLKLSMEWAFLAVASTTLFQPDLSVFRRINWATLLEVLNDNTKHLCTPSRAPVWTQGRVEVFAIFFQVAALARLPDSRDTQAQLTYLSKRLDIIDKPVPMHGTNGRVPANVTTMFKLRWSVIVRCVRIHQIKVALRGACSESTAIHALVDESLQILRLMEIDSEVNSQWSIWPLPSTLR